MKTPRQRKWLRVWSRTWPWAVPLLILTLSALILFQIAPRPTSTALTSHRSIKVLAYSSFVASWGVGPWIAQEFEKRTGIHVELQDGGDAGLLLAKMKLFSADVVVGFDQFSITEARAQTAWQKSSGASLKTKWADADFTAFDWAPLSFVYRKADFASPPARLDDLLDSRFARALSLEDPRTSSPGLLFLYWVLEAKGVDEGFSFLQKLKPNIARVSPSWSTAYGFFTKKQAKLAFSYFTSPVYHAINEHDSGYSAVSFAEGQPVQVEYAGSPASCESCAEARQFLDFILEPEVQAKIMSVNAMFPVIDGLTVNTPFAQLPAFHVLPFADIKNLQAHRAEWLARWQGLGL